MAFSNFWPFIDDGNDSDCEANDDDDEDDCDNGDDNDNSSQWHVHKSASSNLGAQNLPQFFGGHDDDEDEDESCGGVDCEDIMVRSSQDIDTNAAKLRMPAWWNPAGKSNRKDMGKSEDQENKDQDDGFFGGFLRERRKASRKHNHGTFNHDDDEDKDNEDHGEEENEDHGHEFLPGESHFDHHDDSNDDQDYSDGNDENVGHGFPHGHFGHGEDEDDEEDSNKSHLPHKPPFGHGEESKHAEKKGNEHSADEEDFFPDKPALRDNLPKPPSAGKSEETEDDEDDFFPNKPALRDNLPNPPTSGNSMPHKPDHGDDTGDNGEEDKHGSLHDKIEKGHDKKPHFDHHEDQVKDEKTKNKLSHVGSKEQSMLKDSNSTFQLPSMKQKNARLTNGTNTNNLTILVDHQSSAGLISAKTGFSLVIALFIGLYFFHAVL